MIAETQITDSNHVPALSHEESPEFGYMSLEESWRSYRQDEIPGGHAVHFRAPGGSPGCTVGGDSKRYLSSSLCCVGFDNSARDILFAGEDGQVLDEARHLLSTIHRVFLLLRESGVSFDSIPPIRAFRVEDGSILIEWIFSDFRVGFSVEPNPEDSGWYLVSNRKLGEISASGYLCDVDIGTLVVWLASFALLYT